MSTSFTPRIIHAASWGIAALLAHTSALGMDETAIVSNYHDRCLSVGQANEDGQTINVSDCTKENADKWVFEPTIEGTYVIRSSSDDICLDASPGEESGYQIGDPIIRFGCHRKQSQQWEITSIPSQTNAFTLKSVASGLCAEVLYTNEILQVDCRESSDQVFRSYDTFGARISLDKHDYAPEYPVSIDYNFGKLIGSEITANTWIGILPENYETLEGTPHENALQSTRIKSGQGTGSVNLMAPKTPNTYVVRAFLHEDATRSIGPATPLMVRDHASRVAEARQATEQVASPTFNENGIEFCGQVIAYDETVVSCSDLAVTDLTPLLELDSVKSLDLSNSGVMDLSIIAHLSSLEYLHLNNTDVKDISPLAQNSALVFLNIAQTEVISIEALKSMSDLSVVNIMGTALAQDERKTQEELQLLNEIKSGLEVII